jgi:hypothetical protein
LLLAVLAAAIACSPPSEPPPGPPPDTASRLGRADMEALAANALSVVPTGDLALSEKVLERSLASVRAEHGPNSVEEADLLMSYAVLLFNDAHNRDDERLQRAALPWLERAVPAYRAAFGADHPEVALALHSLADVLVLLNGKAPTEDALAALREAIAIRTRALGPSNPETLAGRARLASLEAHPSRIAGDAARLNAAAAAFEAVIRDAPDDPRLGYQSAPQLRLAKARMLAANRDHTRSMAEAERALEAMRGWSAADRCQALMRMATLREALEESGAASLAAELAKDHRAPRRSDCI